MSYLMNKLFFVVLVQILFSTVSNVYSQENVGFNFSTAGEIEFIVTDKWNRRTGLDPRGAMIQYTEIPDAGYGAEGYGEDMSFVTFTHTHFSPDDDGTYEIKFIGTNLNKFKFSIFARSRNSALQKVKKDIDTFIEKDAEMTYKFTYYGNPATPANVEKVININSLGQDIATGGKLNLVGNQTFIKNLLSHCDQMAKHYNAGKKEEAYNSLNEIKKTIQNASRTSAGKMFVNDYAYKVLSEDIDLTFRLIGYTHSSADPIGN